jgi:hypothetical protein
VAIRIHRWTRTGPWGVWRLSMMAAVQEKKRAIEKEENEAQAVADRAGLSIPVLPKAPEDAEAATRVVFRRQQRMCLCVCVHLAHADVCKV